MKPIRARILRAFWLSRPPPCIASPNASITPRPHRSAAGRRWSEAGSTCPNRTADQRHHFAAADIQRHAVQRPAGAEGLAHIPDRQDGGGHRRRGPLR